MPAEWLLRAMREHLNLTQQELGRAARVPQPINSEFWNGRRNPTAAEIKRLATALARLAAAA